MTAPITGTDAIRLPRVRVEQIRRIAQTENMSIPELLAEFVRAKIKNGVIPPEIPGVTVIATGDNLEIAAADLRAEVTKAEALAMAAIFRVAASGDKRKLGRLLDAAALSGLRVTRVGDVGLKIISPVTGKEYVFAANVGPDLADQIEAAIA